MNLSEFHNNFIIREYRKGDFNAINHLWNMTDLGDPKRADDEIIIENSIAIGGTLLILEEKSANTICGTSWMTFDGRRIHLHHFGINPEFQRIGLANILLKESLRYVKHKGFQVKLEVNKSNRIAVDLYLKHGFKPLGDYDIFIIRDVSKI